MFANLVSNVFTNANDMTDRTIVIFDAHIYDASKIRLAVKRNFRFHSAKGYQDDRCVLYVFRCAVYYAEHEERDAEKCKWWYWKDKDYPERE